MVEGDASKALVPVREAYVKFLQEKYAYVQDPANFNTMITFTGVSSMDMAVSTLEARVNAGKRANPEGTIETGWTYQAN
ncbi:MAG TPA: hypothetical protein VL688_08295 [Verrucomicrobiae bacterium]|nr:hypothetical protein [Verrucomicrobiae bacterium]